MSDKSAFLEPGALEGADDHAEVLEELEPAHSATLDADLSSAISDLEQLATVTESLESYSNRFLEIVPADQWTVKTSERYRSGAAAILVAGGFDQIGQIFDISTESSDKATIGSRMKDFILRMWEAFRGFLAMIAEKVTLMVTNYGKTVGAVRKIIASIQARLGKVQGLRPRKEYFDSVPGWSVYMSHKGDFLTPQRALEVAGDILDDDAVKWCNGYAKMAQAEFDIASNGGESNLVELAKRTSVVWDEPFIDFPGGTKITFSGDNSAPGGVALNAKVTVSKSAAKPKLLKVLNPTELSQMVDGLRRLAAAMKQVETALAGDLRTIKNIQRSIRTDKVKVGPRIIAKFITNMVMLPRIMLPMSGSLAREAFMHANASFAQYR